MINSSSMTMLTFVFIFQKWFDAIGWSWWTVLLSPWALLFGLIYLQRGCEYLRDRIQDHVDKQRE